MWMWSTGINRNIVECKAVICRKYSGLSIGINRNIVECKVGPAAPDHAVVVVLIETLWNVKTIRISVLSCGLMY